MNPHDLLQAKSSCACARMLSVMRMLLVMLAIAAPAAAQSFGNRFESRSQGEAVRKVYAPVVAQANSSVLDVLIDGELRVLGTVVAEDLVVTKYSELPRKVGDANNPAKLECRQGKSAWLAKQIGFDRPADLVLLRVIGAKLTPVQWQSKVPAIGAFLACPDGDNIPMGIGILAAQPYKHSREQAFLGIRFASTDGPAKLAEVVAHGAARAAGLLAGDTVVQFEEAEIDETQQLRQLIQLRNPGDTVHIKVLRDGQEQSFVVKLGTNHSARTSGQEDHWGELSELRSGFQEVLQHDTVLLPKQCGGPLVDLSGKVLGVNIARAGRVETLALPAAQVQALVRRMLAAANEPQAASKVR